jgi:outer membrane protein assembly factor BamA
VTAAAPAKAKQLVLLIAIAVALLTPGCLRQDYPEGAYVISKVSLAGADAVDPNEVLAGLATAESPRFLGIWDGVVFDYEVFDETLLERDLDRIVRYYRARGYYEASVTAARIERTDDHHVRVEIRVHEGDIVRIAGSLATPGLERLPFDVAVAASRALVERPGDRFDEAVYAKDKASLLRALVDNGYAFAKV